MTATTTSSSEFLVRKDDLHQTRWRTMAAPPLAAGQVRLQLAGCALTANNITYAAFGEAMNYWGFYPSGEQEWGCIPVWGFARVVESACADIAVGARYYGYFPMASHVTLQPARVSATGFYDGAAHRAALHPVYNHYQRCSADAFYSASTEDLQALLRPLFITSFLIDDFLADNDYFDACAPGQRGLMLLSSASSKTAYGTAFQLAQRKGLELVGLTSPSNVAFCQSLGLYDRVLAYDALESLPANAPCIYIDFAGNAALRQRLHGHFVQLKYSCAIGGTHVDQLVNKGAPRDPLARKSDIKATLFFAPAQIKKRHADWGAAVLHQRLLQAWQSFTQQVSSAATPWVRVVQHEGQAAVAQAYQLVLRGQGDPQLGHIVRVKQADL